MQTRCRRLSLCLGEFGAHVSVVSSHSAGLLVLFGQEGRSHFGWEAARSPALLAESPFHGVSALCSDLQREGSGFMLHSKQPWQHDHVLQYPAATMPVLIHPYCSQAFYGTFAQLGWVCDI